MEMLTIPHTSGKETIVPYCQFVLNEDQQFACIAIDFDKYGGWKSFFCENEYVEYAYRGKLSQQGGIFESQVINSLKVEGWDFEKNPDPEIIIITKK